MMTEVVTFKLPAGSKREDGYVAFETTALIWADNPDLNRKKIRQVYGAEPSSQFFETPIVVDNAVGEFATDHAVTVAA